MEKTAFSIRRMLRGCRTASADIYIDHFFHIFFSNNAGNLFCRIGRRKVNVKKKVTKFTSVECKVHHYHLNVIKANRGRNYRLNRKLAWRSTRNNIKNIIYKKKNREKTLVAGLFSFPKKKVVCFFYFKFTYTLDF